MDDARPNPPAARPDRPVLQPPTIGRIVAPLIRLIALLIGTIAVASLFSIVNDSAAGGVVISQGSGMSQILLDVAPDGRMSTAPARMDPSDPLHLTNTLVLRISGTSTSSSIFPSLSWWPQSSSYTITLNLLGADTMPPNAAPPPLSDLRAWGRILEASPDSIDNGAWYRSVGQMLVAAADENEHTLFTRPRLAIAAVLWVVAESLLIVRRRSTVAPNSTPPPYSGPPGP